MLSDTLNTNEVKNASGTEVEFTRLQTVGRTTEFKQSAEAPNLPHRLKVAHTEIGTGSNMRRRSKVGIEKSVAGVSLATRKIICNLTLDAPVGDLDADTEIKNVIAEVLSFAATTGAATTVLFDCTGNGATALTAGSL